MPLKQHEADKLIDVIRTLVAPELDRPHQKLNADQRKEMERIEKAGKSAPATMDRKTLEGTSNAGDIVTHFDDPKLEELYQAFKTRLLEELPIDPVLLHLLTVRPEILVDIEKRTVNLDGTGADLKGRIARLIAAGFLSQPRRANDISNELARTGSSPAGNRLSEALDWLKKAGFLILDDRFWIAAPGVKVTERTIEA